MVKYEYLALNCIQMYDEDFVLAGEGSNILKYTLLKSKVQRKERKKLLTRVLQQTSHTKVLLFVLEVRS